MDSMHDHHPGLPEPQKFVMLEVSYTRLPGTENYKGYVKAVRVTRPGGLADPQEKELLKTTFEDLNMEDVVYTMHEFLQTWRHAKVTVIRPRAKEYLRTKPSPAVELDDKMRDLIRDDLEAAYKMFAPIEQTIKVRDTTIKEEEDGERKK